MSGKFLFSPSPLANRIMRRRAKQLKAHSITAYLEHLIMKDDGRKHVMKKKSVRKTDQKRALLKARTVRTNQKRSK